MSTPEVVPLPEAPEHRPQEYVADVGFSDLGLSPELLRAVAERGYSNPTPVQAKAYGPVVAGKDLIVRSKTGTGKTAAFGMPILDKLPKGARGVRALMLCPTRELALQVAAELTELAKYRDIEVVAIYGGASMKQQEDALERGAAIVVGTPGRVFDHIRRKNLDLSKCDHAVLDEADEMLNQGFYEEVTRILDYLPKQRQVLLFSATVPEDIQRLIAKYTNEPETLLLSGDVFTVEHIQHIRYELSDAYPKPRNLIYVLEMEEPENAIVFCNTRDDTELVTAVLNRNGFDAELLNGDLPQKERERVMAKVKRGEVAFMVATDIAARGIDISDLKCVVNYSLPEDPAVYLHRAGRTGRIGKKGVALNLTSGRELATLTALEKKYGINFERRQMPSPEQALQMWTDRHVSELKEAALGAVTESFLELASNLKKRPDADELIAFMLKFFFAARRKERASHGPGEEREREPKRESSRSFGGREERGGRGGRDEHRRGGREDRERGGRREREERPRRHEDRPSTAVTQPNIPAVTIDAATPKEGSEAPVEVAATRPPAAPANSDRPKKMSDRELFEALQSGKPLPPMGDPTASSGASSSEGEVRAERPRRERGERSERGEKRERGERRERTGDGERGPGEPRKRGVSKVIPPAEGEARVWINLGTLDGFDSATMGAALEGLGAPAGKLHRAEVLRAFSYLFVADEDVVGFEQLTGKKHGEKAIRAERARK
ncbi:MAG: DEAD/DEAH box helicase [Myxococcaceae bacterium]